MMLASIERIISQAHSYVLEQAQRGAPLVGYVYGFAPPELLRAAGCVPVRLTHSGGHEAQLKGQQLTGGNTCAYCKAVVGSHDRFPYKRLALLVSDGLCEALRRAAEVWAVRLHRNVHTLSAPRVDNPCALTHYVEELRALQAAVSSLSGRPFDERALQREIERGNEVRAWLRRINRFRREHPPRLLASEMWALARASVSLPPERALMVLKTVFTQLSHQRPLGNQQMRLLLLGSFLAEDDRALVDLIEANGGQIVADGLSEGQGLFWRDISKKNPWRALAEHALEGPWHIQRPQRALVDFVNAEIGAVRPRGIVYKTLEFCDPWTLQAKRVKATFPLPFLHIDSDYSSANQEQLRTRVEAFLEML